MMMLLSAEDRLSDLQAELRRRFPSAGCEVVGPSLIKTDAPVLQSPPLMFLQQALPAGEMAQQPSVAAWARAVVDAALAKLDETVPWRLHLMPLYGEGKAGTHRVRLIRDAVREQLQKRRRALLRSWDQSVTPFTEQTSLVQLILTAPDVGVLSVSRAPEPFTARHAISFLPAGLCAVPVDKQAPSRAFTKLVEAQTRLQLSIQPGQSVVDLGACPGGWTYIAVHQGARVLAVDRTELRDDLMRHRSVSFIRGDAFAYRPEQRVDWMICDVIAAPERSVELLERWVAERWMRHFVISIKFKQDSDFAVVDRLATSVAPLCDEFRLLQLSANKNEACATGRLRSA
jgi:23S rRNA (cytidine2498-2'-O)-methyltransferase